ncbi:hypothetical protein ABT288_01630 [Streptomyces sp. NPDC001093]|uniref:hypothetical protein n=1 Tax=Streptomyces sp. NPDC001093 TaxID=3154376 RepID=UPI003321C85F
MNRSLLTMRSALVLLLGVLVGAGAGVLTACSGGGGVAQPVMVGASAFAAAVAFFDSIIDQAH